jgi:bifunctional non-homologous end joining protein LigD
VPLAWSELAAAKTPERFTIATVPGRLVRLRRDPWEEYWTTRQRIPRRAVRALERM